MEKLTLEWCFKYYNARIIIADTTAFANVRCMGIPNSPQALDALEKYGQLQLRPLSSLTDEEEYQLELLDNYFDIINDTGLKVATGDVKFIDTLREWNVDIDGLQQRGVAVYE